VLAEPPPQLARTANDKSAQASVVIRSIRTLRKTAAFGFQRSFDFHCTVRVTVVECCADPEVLVTVMV
jgi:hypothetical protein